MKIALVQMDVVSGDPEANLEVALAGIDEAARDGAELVVLPELWSAGYVWREGEGYRGSRRAGDFALDFRGDSAILADLAGRARDHRMWVVGGSLPEGTNRGIFNCTPVFDPGGALVHRYRKVHLIGLMEEDVHMIPGEECRAFSLGDRVAGAFICYDLRFPELGRNLFIDGAQLILVPAQWPAARAKHWRSLLVARAIENQCFVAGCNRVGRGGPDTFAGGSLVVDPGGDILVEGDDEPGVLMAELDFARVEGMRDVLPCLRDRRPDAYRR